MGGALSGNIASKLAVSAFINTVKGFLRPAVSRKQLESMLTSAVSLANDEVYARAKADSACVGMGTTLVGAAFSGEKAVIINVGDSRAYRITNEDIARITRDHSLVEDMVLSGEISSEEARNHPSKNLITKAVGTDVHVEGDLYPVDIDSGEYILLCTDGLTNLVTDQEILYEILYGGDISNCCDRLAEIANDRGGFDNITVVLIEG